MSNCCWTRVTPDFGSTPAFCRPANSSNSLPKPQLPTFLPARLAAVVRPESFHETCNVPERW